MTDAYQCERCEEYNHGSGNNVRVGEYNGNSGFTPDYDFEWRVELCDDCKNVLYAAVSKVMDDE